MHKRLATIAAVAALSLASCGQQNPNIPEDKCAEVIFEIHRADAILNVKGLSDSNLGNDSLSYYNYVFAKTGVTRKEFLESIKWYINHPDKYNTLYKKVVKLSNQYEQDERARYEVSSQRESNDIWDMKRNWNLPLDGDKNPISFNIKTSETGMYTLGADITYYPDDQSVEPAITLIAEYDDGSIIRNSVIDIIKDGQQRHVEVMLNTESSKKLVCLRGWVLDHSSDTESKHVDCYNISLKRTKE